MDDIVEKDTQPETQLEVDPNLHQIDTKDAHVSDKRLLELGYKPEFRREMSLWGVLGMSFCAIGILTGMSAAFQTGLFSGGPLGMCLTTRFWSCVGCLWMLDRTFLGLECTCPSSAYAKTGPISPDRYVPYSCS